MVEKRLTNDWRVLDEDGGDDQSEEEDEDEPPSKKVDRRSDSPGKSQIKKVKKAQDSESGKVKKGKSSVSIVKKVTEKQAPIAKKKKKKGRRHESKNNKSNSSGTHIKVKSTSSGKFTVSDKKLFLWTRIFQTVFSIDTGWTQVTLTDQQFKSDKKYLALKLGSWHRK